MTTTTTTWPRFLMLVLLSLTAVVIHAQRLPETQDEKLNFFEIQKRYAEQFRSKNKDGDETLNERERDGDEAKFRRFEMFWEPRIDEKGNFSTYHEKLLGVPLERCDCAGSCNKTFWTFLGPDSLPPYNIGGAVTTQNMGAIMSVWVHPTNPQEILAGTYSAGLYKTTNGGIQWRRLTQSACKGDCPDFPHGGVSSIAVDPQNSNTIYITLGINRSLTTDGYSYGVYKSTDGGATWCPTDLQFRPTDFVSSTKIVMDPADSNTLFAIAGNKVYKTTNAGATWKSNVISAPNLHEIQDIAISRNPGSAGLFFSEAADRCFSQTCPGASGWNCPLADGKIWYDPSFNGAAMDITSQALGPVTGSEVRVERALFSVTSNSVSILALADPHNSTCSFGAVGDRTIARNFNNAPPNAGSWIQHFSPPGANDSHSAAFASAFAVSPMDDNLVLIGSDNGAYWLDSLFVSNDGGASFGLNQFCLHADLRAMAFARKDSVTGEVWIIGNDGGVAAARVNAGGPAAPCQDINGSGLNVTDFFGISNSELDPSKLYAGSQDNGVFDTTTGAWRTLPLFDAYDAVSDMTDPQRAYITTNGGFMETTNGGNTWAGMSLPPPAQPKISNAPMLIDRSNTLYIAQQDVWRLYPAATNPTWNQLSAWTGPALRALHIPPLNSSIIIAAKDGADGIFAEKVFRTDSAHFNSIFTTWTPITFNLPVYWQRVTGITSDERGDRLWVGMGNFGPHVLELEKGSQTWKDISQGLPDLPVNAIRYWEGSNDDSLFVATDTGVYYRNRNLTEWKRVSCELPNLLMSDLEINNRTQKLRVSTRGGGIWETSLSSIRRQGCSADSYLEVSYATATALVTKKLQTDSVITDAAIVTQISVTPRKICCLESCDIVSNYDWKVYRVPRPSGNPILVGTGQNSPATWTASFEEGFFFRRQRYDYRIEVTGRCNGQACPTVTLQFNRW